MNGYKFATLPIKEKEKIVKSVIRAANKDQRKLVEKSRKVRSSVK